MEYIKQNFTDGQTLKAEHLNYIEDGIDNAIKNDANTLALAKAYTDSQRLAYVEVNSGMVSFRPDDLDGKESFPGEILGAAGTYVKVLDFCVTEESLKSISYFYIRYPDFYGSVNEFTVYHDEFAIMFNVPFDGGDRTAVLSIIVDVPVDETTTITKGTYVLCIDDPVGKEFTSSFTYETETIHPIDPKYLPDEFVEAAIKLPLINKVVTVEDVSKVYIKTDTNGNSFDVTEYDMRVYVPNGGSEIAVQAFIEEPTWVSFVTAHFKTDGCNVIRVNTLGTPNWVSVKSKSYGGPHYDSGWTSSINYMPDVVHATSFAVANWSGVIPAGTVVEVYGR